MRLILACIAVFPGPAIADPQMTATDFAAYVGTDTVTYGYSDGSVGIADYGPDQTLRWKFEGATTCTNGSFRQSGDELCFDFEAQDLAACWHFARTAGGLHGTGVGEIAGFRIFQINRSNRPLSCAEVGV